MTDPKIELVWDARNELGEGPLWDTREQQLYWLDSKGPTVNRYDPRSGSVKTWKVPSDVGSMALRENGGAIVALRDGIFALDFDTGKTELMMAIEAENPRTRLNDGKVDRRGRFFVGGMDEQETGRMAGLYRFDPKPRAGEIGQRHRLLQHAVLEPGRQSVLLCGDLGIHFCVRL